MPTLLRIAPELPVSDLPESIKLYERKLGFRNVMTMPDYAIIERHGVAVHLFQAAGEKHAAQSIHIFTDGLDELHAEMRQRGTCLSQDIVRKPWGNRDFRVQDAFGKRNKVHRTAELKDPQHCHPERSGRPQSGRPHSRRTCSLPGMFSDASGNSGQTGELGFR